MQKIAWTSWDDVSKLGQRIALELAAFAAGGGIVALAGRIGFVAANAARAGNYIRTFRGGTLIANAIPNALRGASGALTASGARDFVHEGQFHWSEAGWGAAFGVVFPYMQRASGAVLGRIGALPGIHRINNL